MSKSVLQRLAENRKVHKLQTDEGAIYFRGLNGAQRAEYLRTFRDVDDERALQADQHLCAMALCNEDGSAAFESESEAIESMLSIDIPVVRMIARSVLEQSGLLAEEKQQENPSTIQS